MTAGEAPSAHHILQAEDWSDCRVVSVSGRIDHASSPVFLEELKAHAGHVPDGGGMVIDLSNLEFITSAGLRSLLLAQRTLSEGGARLAVCGLRGVVKEVFRISKFDALLSVTETTQEALAEISPDAARSYSG